MADDENPSGDEADDDALHEQSRAQLDRLRNDPKAQRLLHELEGDLAPGEDPAFWTLKHKGRRPAPASEQAEHYDNVTTAPVAKPDERGQSAGKVVVSAEARAAEVIADLAAGAGMDPEEFKKLPRGDPALKTAVSARRLAEAERTISGTARLEKPAGLGEDVSAEVARRVRDDGFDPGARTLGGRTERGLPTPAVVGDEPEERAPTPPTEAKQQRTLMLLGATVIVAIALVFFVMHQPPRGIVEAPGGPTTEPRPSASAAGAGQAPPAASSSAAATGSAPAAAATDSSAAPDTSADAAPAPAATGTAGGAAPTGAAPPPPTPSKPRPPTQNPPRPTSTSGLYPDI